MRPFKVVEDPGQCFQKEIVERIGPLASTHYMA